MLCRLCLSNLKEDNGVSLFNNSGERELIEIIAKFLQLELRAGDAACEIICNDCWMHLDDFQKFCIYVEDRQNTLLKELPKVVCVVDLDDDAVVSECVNPCLALSFDVSSNQSEEQVIDSKDESTLDIKEVVIEQNTEVPTDVIQQKFDYGNTFGIDTVAKEDISKNDIAFKTLLKKKANSRTKSKEPKNNTATEKNTFKASIKKKVKTEKLSDVKSKIKAKTKINALLLEKANSKEPSKHKEDVLKSDEFIANNMELKCEMCELILDTFSQLKAHFRSEHNCNGYVRCCSKRLTKRRLLVDHIEYHLNPLHFQCLECNKVLATRDSHTSHMSIVHPAKDELKFQCEFCPQRFVKQYLLDIHLKKHSNKGKEHLCQICQKSFATSHCLKMHIQRIHENAAPSQICNYCGRKFKCNTTFKQHIAGHEGIAINPPVQCSICNDWLKNKYILRVHMKSHNPTNIACKECGHVCTTRRVLTNHISRVHNNSHSYDCTICGNTYKKRISLKEHMSSHNGEKSNNCPHCPSTFRSKANMYKHIKNLHKNEWLASRNTRSKALEEIAKKSDHNKLE